MWLGGTAVIIAAGKKAAYAALKKHHPKVVPFEECRFEEVPEGNQVLYFYDGNY